MTDFEGKLKNVLKKVTSNKVRRILAENELNGLSKKVEGYQKMN